MERFEKDELSDRELDAMLPAWSAPEMPGAIRARLFPKPWWRKIASASIRVPVPVACALAVMLGFGAKWSIEHKPAAPQVVVRTERVEVPVVKERVVYRDREARAIVWRPVTELRPRIIRSRNE
jgi:hypothetical protein